MMNWMVNKGEPPAGACSSSGQARMVDGPLRLDISLHKLAGTKPVHLGREQRIQADACLLLVYNGSLGKLCFAGEQQGYRCMIVLPSTSRSFFVFLKQR
jgi:hypothetical protein